ncbi:MAG TPA: hypothetical protein VFQ85_03990 [Mycobacteriales bacterium]|nr:hypothetical protein [Mycobacteriales bacterium]
MVARRALVAALLLAAACDRTPARLPDRTPAEIWAAARAGGAAHVTVTFATTAAGATFTSTATGTVDLARHRSSVHVEQDGYNAEAGLFPTDEVAVDGRTYVRRPGRRWFVATGSVGMKPYDVVALLAEVRELTRTGDEVVRGQRVVRYAGTAQRLTVEVWARRDGRPLRVRTTEDGPGRITRTVELERYGGEPEVVAPPDATPVRDVTKLFEAARRS